ncbi:MAG: hypothetical protein HeimC2_03970 [Candidatus Heimdallarchaeota archaeon LC_2]|nr:MAG: hypothetical protein HeimC2_03970 [Candidatus Heimdallarchaeota archaeon LC_2]
MSKNSETGISKNLDLFEGLVGLIFIIFTVTIAIVSSDRRDQYYLDNPDIVPGTYLFIGLMILMPMFLYGIWLFAKGIWTLLIELVERASDNAGQAS